MHSSNDLQDEKSNLFLRIINKNMRTKIPTPRNSDEANSLIQQLQGFRTKSYEDSKEKGSIHYFQLKDYSNSRVIILELIILLHQ